MNILVSGKKPTALKKKADDAMANADEKANRVAISDEDVSSEGCKASAKVNREARRAALKARIDAAKKKAAKITARRIKAEAEETLNELENDEGLGSEEGGDEDLGEEGSEEDDVLEETETVLKEYEIQEGDKKYVFNAIEGLDALDEGTELGAAIEANPPEEFVEDVLDLKEVIDGAVEMWEDEGDLDEGEEEELEEDLEDEIGLEEELDEEEEEPLAQAASKKKASIKEKARRLELAKKEALRAKIKARIEARAKFKVKEKIGIKNKKVGK